MKKKTLREWFLKADADGHEWASKAMHNAILENSAQLNREFPTLRLGLFSAFGWRGTPEGYKYWETVYNRLYDDNL